MGLLAKASVAIDGSKFKAVNSRDNNFTKGKLERRLKQIEESVARYLSQIETADRQPARIIVLSHFVIAASRLRNPTHPRFLATSDVATSDDDKVTQYN